MRCLILVSVLVGLAVLYFIGNVQADESLVLYFPFDEGSGDEVADFSGYDNNGVLIPAGDWVDGKFGGAIQVTSAAGHAELNSSDSITGDIFMRSFTLAAYINPALSDTWGHIWRSRPNPGSGHNTLFVNAGGYMSWRGTVGGSWTVLCEGTAGDIVADEWQHVALVGDESKYRMYVNGKMVMESAFIETDGAIEIFYVGGDGLSENYTGAIDEVAVWSRVLSDEEIMALCTDGVQVFMAVEPENRLPSTWGSLKVY